MVKQLISLGPWFESGWVDFLLFVADSLGAKDKLKARGLGGGEKGPLPKTPFLADRRENETANQTYNIMY